MKFKIFLSTLLIVFIFLCSCSKGIDNEFKINFIDVGQGDSILIENRGVYTLIDGGPQENYSYIKKYLNKKNIKKIDNLVLTHPHDDHFGGFIDLLKDININNFYTPKVFSDNEDFKYLLYILNKNNNKVNIIKSSEKIDIGEDATGIFLAPNSNNYDNINDYSAVLKVCYKNVSFLLDGDAEEKSELEMLSKDIDLKSDVIKIGHHGSKTATNLDFLNQVSPKIAIISCGIQNKFGHPHKETLDKLKINNIKTYRTDYNGTIKMKTDGNKIFISTEN